jgi:hypothetical protein
MDGIDVSLHNVRHVDNVVYFMPRDEDCENLFHSTADFVSINLRVANLSLIKCALLLDEHLLSVVNIGIDNS